MTAPAAILRAAADLVERGWCQGAYAMDATGRWLTSPWDLGACRFCAIGAIDRSAPDKSSKLRAQMSLEGHVNRAALWAWNDDPQQTQASVATAMRQCADRMDAEGGR